MTAPRLTPNSYAPARDLALRHDYAPGVRWLRAVLGLRTRVRASGMRYELAALSLLAVTGCATGGASRAAVVNVATHDLSCERVDVAEVSENKYAAYGCGRGAVYTQLCEGSECRWGRLRHGHESNIAAASQPPVAEPREILPAPAPEPRQVLPAPPPAQREVIPAPPPAASAPGAEQGALPLQPGAAPAAQAPAPLSLSDGELSEAYETQVPAQPVAQQTSVPPPVPLVETRPLPPVQNYVWISGYWWWGMGPRWVWAPGYWCPPYYGYSYIPGSWYWSGGYWNYGPGGWARPGTTIIINRNFPPRPSTVAVTRAFTPHRVVRGSAPASTQRVVRAPAAFQPRGSPMMPAARVSRPDYSTSRGTPAGGYGKSRFGADGVGRVVAPGSSARPRSDFSSRGYAPPSSGGSREFSRPSSGGSAGGGRSFSSGGGGRSFSSGGGGGRSSGGGGGGRSFSGGGGAGGSRGGMAPARVSPGGGGGGRRR